MVQTIKEALNWRGISMVTSRALKGDLGKKENRNLGWCNKCVTAAENKGHPEWVPFWGSLPQRKNES